MSARFVHGIAPARRRAEKLAYRPLRKSQIHISSSLSLYPLVLLQAAAHDASCDGEVAVVAVFGMVELADLNFCKPIAMSSVGQWKLN